VAAAAVFRVMPAARAAAHPLLIVQAAAVMTPALMTAGLAASGLMASAAPVTALVFGMIHIRLHAGNPRFRCRRSNYYCSLSR